MRRLAATATRTPGDAVPSGARAEPEVGASCPPARGAAGGVVLRWPRESIAVPEDKQPLGTVVSVQPNKRVHPTKAGRFRGPSAPDFEYHVPRRTAVLPAFAGDAPVVGQTKRVAAAVRSPTS